MPRLQSLAPVFRPLAASRAVTCRQHFRFSTATQFRADTPPQSVQPIQSSEKPDSARAADLAATEAVTESDSAQPPEAKPELPSKRRQESAFTNHNTLRRRADRADAVPSPTRTTKPNTTQALKSTTPPATPPTASIPLSPPRYHVSRSASKNLPIYTDYKRGGNLHLTTVRKITGDLSALRDELRVFLNKKNEDVKINALTGHVIVKGHCKPEVQRFLEGRGM
ncbi:Img2-domain-containing protein [Setomelanomma holmii]|uniref:Large ribosomal subunit protein mL49 n=1 Tax=Setomelanomma holmii TaxID=210430 RepID=A0A9P4GYN5_9PLEO|nr:Img2-domain-containing protein [Setomelanomma holmii]